MADLELPVYTRVFRLRRRLYRIYDIELPLPVTLPQVGAFLLAGAVVFAVLQVAGIELSPASAWAYLVPPGVAAWLANRPVDDDRSPLQWMTSQVRYLLEPRAVDALEPRREASTARLQATVWGRRA